MNDPQGRKLARLLYLITAAIALPAAGGAWLLAGAAVAGGLLGGAVLGGLMLGGLLLLVYVVIAPSAGGAPASWRYVALALQVAKYVVALGFLYLLVVWWQVNVWALAGGLLIPLLALTVLVALAPRGRRQAAEEELGPGGEGI